MDEMQWNIQFEQSHQRFAWHGARYHIASNDYLVYLCLTNIVEDRLECGKVPMNIVECSRAHKLGHSGLADLHRCRTDLRPKRHLSTDLVRFETAASLLS